TRSSVVWADRMVAARSWNGPWWRSAQSSPAVPGYSAASRAAVSRARPFGLLGLAMTATTLPSMHHVEVKRQMGQGDIAAVSELLDVAAEADGHRPLGEHQWLDLVHGGREGFAGLVAWEPGHGHPVGYAQVTRGPHSWALEYAVDPHHRDDGCAIGHDLVRSAIELVAGEGGGHVHLWVNKPTADDDGIALSNGLEKGRDLLQMRRPLPVGEPWELETRPFEPGRDEETWLEVNNRPFSRHPEQGRRD